MKIPRRILAILALMLAIMTEIAPNVIGLITTNMTTQRWVVSICSIIFIALFIYEIIEQNKKDKTILTLETSLQVNSQKSDLTIRWNTHTNKHGWVERKYFYKPEITAYGDSIITYSYIGELYDEFTSEEINKMKEWGIIQSDEDKGKLYHSGNI